MTDFHALIVDDEKTYGTALARALRRRDVECDVALDAESAISKARSAGPYQVVLLDNRLPDTLGLRIIPRLRAIMPGAAIVMMTAYESIPDAVEAMRLGAEDYISKSTRTEPIVARVMEARERMLARDGYDPSIPPGRDESLLGQSEIMRTVRDRLDEVASSPGTPVLIAGEVGTGKSVAARYIHRRGHAPNAPFVTLGCAAGPAGPADSVVFGRIRHTVSGGDIIEDGVLENAGDGVIYLDAIDEAPDRLQKMLLAVLESGTFRRVGSSEEIRFRARTVASARSVPESGKLHERLIQSLDVFPVTLPPLRERGDDFLSLANLFIDHFNARMGKSVAHLDGPVVETLSAYDFPGNVRELRNVIERAMILVRGERIFPEHLPDRVMRDGGRRSSIPPDPGDEAAVQQERTEGQGLGIEFTPGVDTIDSVEKRLIVQAMELSDGVKSRAAKLLGISRFQLLRRLEKYGLEKKK